MNTAAQKIIDDALQQLQKNSQIKGIWKPVNQKEVDGAVILTINKENLRHLIQVKNELRPQQMGQILALHNQMSDLMIVATRLSPMIKEELRNNQIAYLEGNGNIYIQNKVTLIWIDVASFQ